ncbi:MAG TPA: TIGR03435 family protein [Bryobacteraceae bacterium]|nr:TIGR03435 family protein [Bryobacteraceae bacterium]
MRKRLACWGIIIAFVPGMLATAAAQEPGFDAASVKQCKPDDDPGRLIFSGQHLLLTCMFLNQIISIAYGKTIAGQWSRFPSSAIEGEPAWIHDRYTIDARTDHDAGENAVKGPMLRALLEDRFRLRVRRETRQVAAFALTLDRHGSKLKPFDGTCTPWDTANPEKPTAEKPLCTVTRGGRGWIRNFDFRGITIATLVQQLNQNTGDLPVPVVDRTGIEGRFDVHLEYDGQQNAPPDGAVTAPQLPAALEEQLGLRLEKITAPWEFLVIENLERPTAN